MAFGRYLGSIWEVFGGYWGEALQVYFVSIRKYSGGIWDIFGGAFGGRGLGGENSQQTYKKQTKN